MQFLLTTLIRSQIHANTLYAFHKEDISLCLHKHIEWRQEDMMSEVFWTIEEDLWSFHYAWTPWGW